MHALSKTILFGTLCLLLSTVASGERQSAERGLEKLMTAEEYQRAGLHKLSQDELRALEAWFRDHAQELGSSADGISVTGAAAIAATAPGKPAAETAAAQAEENFGFPEPRPKEKEEAVLHAEIIPPFRGWSGKTIFRLDNGQIWQQRSSGHHTYTGDDYRVAISKNAMGFYEMRLLAADRSVGVKRIR